MTLISLCPKERSAELIKEGLSTIHSHAIHQEKIIKELREQLKLSEDKVRELTHENDDYDDLVPDGVKLSTFDWIEDRLGKADVMEEVIQELQAKNKGLTILKQEAESRSFCYEADIKELKEQLDGVKEGLAEKFYKHYEENDYNLLNVARTIGPDLGRMVDSLMDEEKKLTAENKELEKNLTLSEDKGQAKSDIIINMLDRLIKDANIDDGFYIERQWGHTYSDEHNKIITEEFQELLKDINEDLDGEFEIRTNGYQFDFHYPESEDEEEEVPKEEYVVQGSKVDMEAFKKLKEDGMMPWSK